MEVPHQRILSVRDLLSRPDLAIPDYQRPYRWTEKNVAQLFGDIATHWQKPAYRLGTIVFHANEGRLDIVDGQQRTLTLMLAVRALMECRRETLKSRELQGQLESLDRGMVVPVFSSDISKHRLYENYQAICRIVARGDFDESRIDFLLNRCEVVCFALGDMAEAFQFFDSQNARGRDLEPHDLLKAYHLREFDSRDEALKMRTVERWEASETRALASLFANYLYRVRNWLKGESARYFGKDDTALFKGVNPASRPPTPRYPYAEHLRIVDRCVDGCAAERLPRMEGQDAAFPFQLDQLVINGRRFFEMTDHYQRKVAQIRGDGLPGPLLGSAALDDLAGRILSTINRYEGRHRTGDGYVRSMFDCLLLYYMDKFGEAELSRAIHRIFIWAYRLRLEQQAVQLATMDNYVLENNAFRVMRAAIQPADFFNHSLPAVGTIRSTRTELIEGLFREMRFHG
ncbi:MAG: DUF262 domain-containing protein [Rhodanobacteraceae bacterium]|jgi:hypothetical protein|nr:DUF262 domain-containing protein [Rhodanobacteraceae bacterium]